MGIVTNKRLSKLTGLLLGKNKGLLQGSEMVVEISNTDSCRQAWKLQLTVNDYVNIGPDFQKYIVTDWSAPVEHPH